MNKLVSTASEGMVTVWVPAGAVVGPLLVVVT